MNDHNNAAPSEVVVGALAISVFIFGILPEALKAFLRWLPL